MADHRRIAGAALDYLDPVRVMVKAGVIPDPWQEKFLRSRSTRRLLLCGRQVGKSEVVGAYASFRARYRAPSLVAVSADSQDHARNLFKRIKLYVKPLCTDGVSIVSESTEKIRLSNGSEIIALPGSAKSVRSFSADCAIVDEASFTSDSLFNSFFPTLAATGGEWISMSSAGYPVGWFWSLFTKGGEVDEMDAPTAIADAWERTVVKSADCPRIDPQFLADELDQKGQTEFDREYGCRFLRPEEINLANQPITADLLEKVGRVDGVPLFGE